MKKYLIVVAGGKGLRMGGCVPKQFLPVKGKPVLMRTLETFRSCDNEMELIVVLPEEQQPYWKRLCLEYGFHVPHKVASGGETRFHSVKNGLSLVPDSGGIVGVHDGVRPFVSPEVIVECYRQAEVKGAVIPVVDVVETVRHLLPEGGSETVPRSDYKLVQTPQVFTVKLLKQAYAQDYVPQFTDDASVVEALGHSVCLVPGNRENIKLTTPFDLKIAEALLETDD